MTPFLINGKSYPLHRTETTVPLCDPIAWLSSQSLYPKVFWREKRSSLTHAAVGALLSFSEPPNIAESHSCDRFYGGIRFQDTALRDSIWEKFPASCFWLPQMELTIHADHATIINYAKNTPVADPVELPRDLPFYLQRQDNPSYSQWQNNIHKALESISSGSIDKLVLARKTTLTCAAPISAWPILHRFKDTQHATLFAFQMDPENCFLGATPERLFLREKNQLHTEAIAATRPRGKTPQEDLAFEKALRTCPKELREFNLVKEYLHSTATPLCSHMAWENKTTLLKTPHVQHLHDRLNATLNSTVSSAELLRLFHPTPALGGFPKEQALKQLQQIEPFDRGWYGSAIGTITAERSSFYVAIRSALIQNKFLHLFAGTGIVPGSLPEREWEELEHKIHPFLEIFQLKK